MVCRSRSLLVKFTRLGEQQQPSPRAPRKTEKKMLNRKRADILLSSVNFLLLLGALGGKPFPNESRCANGTPILI
jgi:hypothetical protein